MWAHVSMVFVFYSPANPCRLRLRCRIPGPRSNEVPCQQDLRKQDLVNGASLCAVVSALHKLESKMAVAQFQQKRTGNVIINPCGEATSQSATFCCGGSLLQGPRPFEVAKAGFFQEILGKHAPTRHCILFCKAA